MKAPRRLLAALAVPLVAGAALAAAGTAHAAVKPSLPVVLGASSDGASATWDSAGDVVLKTGTVTASTFARVAVSLKALPLQTAPAVPPSFTTDNYAAGSPRWVIELANGGFVTGYPAQLGGTANDSFTGAQWAVGNSGTYESYAQALAGANDPLGNVQVSAAFIVADGSQPVSSTDVLSDVQYDGLVAVPPAQPIVAVLSHGHVASLNNNRAVLAWQVTPDKVNRFQVTMHVTGPLNNRTGITTIPQASYSGLPAGHTGYITVQALVPDASGKLVPSGRPGTIFFTTTHIIRPA